MPVARPLDRHWQDLSNSVGFMPTSCCSLRSNKSPNQTVVWTKELLHLSKTNKEARFRQRDRTRLQKRKHRRRQAKTHRSHRKLLFFCMKLTTREQVMLSACYLHKPKHDARPTEIATNGKRQKRDNEHRTAHNPKRGAHTSWAGASMVHRGANDIVTLFLGRRSGLTRRPQTSRTQQSHHQGSSHLAIPSQGPQRGIL